MFRPSFDFESNGVSPETQTTVAEHYEEEELYLGELESSEQDDLIRWHSQHSEDVERDESVRFAPAAHHGKSVSVSNYYEIGQKVAEITACRV